MMRVYLSILFIAYFCSCEDHKSHIKEDHRAFLGKRQNEFDELSHEEAIRRLRLLVPHIDVNKDGFLTSEELKIWVQDKYESLLDDPDNDPAAVFRQADTNYDGKVSWAEYLWRNYGIRDNATDNITKELKSHFSVYIIRNTVRWKHADVDMDNYLNQHEFHMFLEPTHFEQMMDVVAQEELEEADSNGDGFISIEEYIDSLHMPDMRSLDEKVFHEQYDKDHDGKLNVDEVKIWKTPELFDKAKLEAKHLIEIADDNKDGMLSSEEVVLHHFVFVGSKVTQTGAILHDEF